MKNYENMQLPSYELEQQEDVVTFEDLHGQFHVKNARSNYADLYEKSFEQKSISRKRSIFHSSRRKPEKVTTVLLVD